MGTLPIDIPHDRIAEFCRNWKIVELSLFGSVLREDFGPESDVHVLVEFAPGAGCTYFDWPEMTDELGKLFGGRSVDLVTRSGVETCGNPWKVSAILDHAQQVYAA